MLKLARIVVVLTALAGLAACEFFPDTYTEYRKSLAEQPWVPQGLGDAWITTPNVRMVLERAYGHTREQKLLLPNSTSLPGDNFVYLRAEYYAGSYYNAARIQPERLLEAIGESPYPFTSGDSSAFYSKVDELGAINWMQWTNGTSLNCVLAFRRLDYGTRVLPGKARTMDILMRNCVSGSVDEALQPILAANVAYSAQGRGAKRGAQLMLSPLAGPRP